LPAVGNRALAAALGVHRADDWSDEGPRSKNLKPIEVPAPAGSGGSSVFRVALFGIVDNEMLTGRAIVVLPTGIPATGGTFDVLVHLHGYEVWSEAKPDKPSRLIWGTGYEDARKRGGDEPIDIGVMKIEQEMAAAGGRMIGIFPQGDKFSDFTAAKGTKGFNLRHYVTAAFTRLQAWIKENDGSIVPKEAAGKVAPGRISLSSHSGGDEALSEMVGQEPIMAGGSGAGDGLAGLFLFDSMIEGKAERKKAAKDKPSAKDPSPFLFEGRVEE
jgi:hypothetical protein